MNKKNQKGKKKNFWKILSENRGLTAVIAALAVALVVGIVVLVSMNTGKKKPPKAPSISVGEDFYHVAPEGQDIKNAITLKNATNAKEIIRKEGAFSSGEDLLPYEKGWCIFDEDGWVRRYRDENGEIHDLPKEEWFEDIMNGGDPLQIIGGLEMHFVLYKNGENAERCYQYYVLTDKSDMEFLLSALNRCGYQNVKQESNLVASVELDQKQIIEEMQLYQAEEETVTPDISVEKYVMYLQERYGMK